MLNDSTLTIYLFRYWPPKIMDFVKNMDPEEKAIIFCGKKARADDLSSEVSLQGIACQCIHGDREQVKIKRHNINVKIVCK